MKKAISLLFIILMISCSKDKDNTSLSYEILNVYPHNTSYFTQGFEFYNGILFEGTGQYNRSKLIKYDLYSGEIFGRVDLPSSYFGEGITVMNGKVYQLTWFAGKCFIYDSDTLEKTGEFSYYGEGWGLCNDGENLIMSNGTSTILFRDPHDFSVRRSISVKESSGNYVNRINELEYVEGRIFANIWEYDDIIEIDPETGVIKGRYDLSDLRKTALKKNPKSDVLNGIAYKNGSFFVTGKYWPYIFELILEGGYR